MPPAPRSRSNRALHTGTELAAAGAIAPERIAAIDQVAARYAVSVTPALLDVMDAGDATDPIARQFIPDEAELETAPNELHDPIGDLSHSPVKGIVHRYPDRVLLTPLLTCPVYCRYCFRRERVGQEKALGAVELEAALDYIRSHDAIWEVILTGGDPLMLPPARIAATIAALNAIPHVRTIRIHSRVPVADPARITPELIAALDGAKPVWLAVHVNHARELSDTARAACTRLAKAGVPLIGQTVLLKGVNDDPATMEALLRAMVETRIKPYYLHHLDLAPGTGHFRTTIDAGQALMKSLRGRVSGLCQPEYVLDIPGGHGKAPIGPVYQDGGMIEDWQGGRHDYAG
ncbi:MAG TPA: lysine-2,3-aminomutase-like protein [Magnetospirillaceae bacterium]